MFLIQLSHYGKEAAGDFILCELIRLWETFESILQVDIQICVNCKILTISLGGNDKSMLLYRESFLRRDLDHSPEQVLAVWRHEVRDVKHSSLHL